ncbi:hypothetical protein [Candidatus Sororendozoicomonas aggregata]
MKLFSGIQAKARKRQKSSFTHSRTGIVTIIQYTPEKAIDITYGCKNK